MIFITVGSQKFQFNRLLKEVDKLIEEKKIIEEVFAQTGYSDYKPKNYQYKNFLDRDEFIELMKKSEKVITHGGTGAIVGAVKQGKKVIAIPRLKEFDEHVDNHQLQIVEQFKELGFINGVNKIDRLDSIINEIDNIGFKEYISNTNNIIESIERMIKGGVKLKKVALIYTGMNIGGAQRVLIDIAKNIKGFEMEAIIISDDGPMIEEIKNAGVKHYKLPLKSKKFKDTIESIKGLISIIKREDVDIVHSHNRYVTMLCNIIKPIIKVPVVHTEHNVFPDKNSVNFRGKNIIAVSNIVREHLGKSGLKLDNIKVIQNGIDIDSKKSNYNFKKELNLDEDCILIGVLARLAKEKGHEFMINSIKDLLLNNNKVKVVFIGDGEERSSIEKLISELRLEESIILLGNRNDVNRIIDNINFFVLPSFYEGLPMSILEIMGNGKVIIATDVGGNKEVIVDGKNGYLIESNNSNVLVDRVKYCIDNIGNMSLVQENARMTISKRFSIERVTNDHKQYYNNILYKNR